MSTGTVSHELQRLGDAYAWAIFSNESPDHTKCAYRYELGRVWAASRGIVCFCMMNPSTADHKKSDLTITKCARFAENWGFGGLLIVNLFAYRSTDPKKLLDAGIDPVGKYNDLAITLAVRNAHLGRLKNGEHIHETPFTRNVHVRALVAAWGTPPSLEPAFRERMKKIEAFDADWECLGITAAGHPKHPSRIGYDTRRAFLRVARAGQTKLSVVK